MLRSSLSFRLLLWTVAAATLCACAQHGTASLPSMQSASSALISPDSTPPKCDGQKDAKRYSSLTVTLSARGGSFCVPEYGGFGGTIKYPRANPSVELTLISSTTDYDHQPKLGKGEAIFYLQLALSGAVSFGRNVRAGGGLESKTIVAGKPYTVYGQAKLSGFPFNFGPCYAVAGKGRYGGVLGGIGTLLKDQDVPGAATGVIEIYTGKQTRTQC